MASVSSKVRKAVDDATESNPDLQAQVAALREDIANITATLGKIGKNRAQDARRSAASSFESAKLRGEETFEDLRLQARELEDQIVETVREKPLTTLAVAAGVGFLLALIARR
ncbi:DUF883 domain-containing protein [Phyllobacterium sp. BT25]|uniref:DUF883 domain-containing protein n=1 Tax=Phyllobacterium pellucidum TaxID=2740464 RepID=A0A849VSF2_9HYPH|nr:MULTISPECIES: DUF883 family protein [Phyllobacterium]NTS32536.1 DUF883 domain-containing protein [Phyllobacterium pellucidum]SFI77832.1 Membrane-anchored ribosome-binding protein, inhibits growth in stationary phase, ElaB/YqjD/DUF883 family [Phyllobacterium sp. CL33Tsu]